ncbi:MAG: SurA N-terminal domain-containing protein [Acidobacteria bacterium]|jgi:peptidyl-prolyl cis-trans isomerase D|nr:SurA N-terminal domain-containing protein [Acidobacteriota bacterium]
MLRTMRNDFKKYSWTLWLVILAFVLGFIVTDAFRGEKGNEDDLIFIDDTTIKVAEYQKQLVNTLRNYKAQLKDNFNRQTIAQFGIPEQVLQQLINKAIIFKEAKKLNITASDKELKKKITSLPYFQRNGSFVGIKEYELMLAHNQISVIEFENDLKEQIIMEKFSELVSSGLVINPDSLEKLYIEEKDTADVEYVLLKPENIKETPIVTDSEIDSYYNDHKEDFKSPERRAGNFIFLKSIDYKKEVSITDKDLRDFFKVNIADYAEQGKTKVSRILLKYTDQTRDEVFKKAEALQKELTPENFAQKAKEYSEDNKAGDGGDHGYFAWQEFSPQEKSIIDSFGQSEISTPIDTGEGFALIFISEKVEAKQQEFDKVKPFIRSSLEREKLDQLMEKKLNDIYQKVHKEQNIKDKAAELGYKVLETGLLTSGEGIKGTDEQGYISRTLFRLKEKQISEPIRLQGGMAIVQLLQVQKPEQESLDKARQRVKDKLIVNKKIQRLMVEARAIPAELNKLPDNTAIEKYVREKDYIFETSPHKRGNRLGGQPYSKGLDEIIFSLPQDTYSPNPIDIGEAVALVKVKNKKLVGKSEFEKEKEKFLAQKLEEMKNNYFNSYLTKKKDAYKVQVNQELFQKIKDYVISRFN